MIEYFHKMGVTAYPLAFCSIIFFAILIERIIYLSSFSAKKARIISSLKGKIEENKEVEKSVRDEMLSLLISGQQESLYCGLKWLRLIGLLSPLLGLFGTIIGLINAFIKIAGTQGAVNPALVADGLYLAMLTTAYGLAVALPALFFASIFKFIADGYIGSILNELNSFSLKIEGVKL